MIDWIWAYVTFKRGARLISGPATLRAMKANQSGRMREKMLAEH